MNEEITIGCAADLHAIDTEPELEGASAPREPVAHTIATFSSASASRSASSRQRCSSSCWASSR
jgi:hypothetical protein